MDDRRVAAVLSGLWAGAIAAIAFIAAPAGFAVLQRTEAGVLAGLLFQREAYAGLAVAVVMLLLVKRRAAVAAAVAPRSAPTWSSCWPPCSAPSSAISLYSP
jgi:hypothetical protein